MCMFPLLFLVILNYVMSQYDFDVDDMAVKIPEQENTEISQRQNALTFGSCKIILDDVCPDPDVNFYLYTSENPNEPEKISVNLEQGLSNLTTSHFNPSNPTKVIVHGYNSDMDLAALVEIRKQYLSHGSYNVFTVDWSPLAMGPCYPGALWNIKHVGRCTSHLIESIRKLGVEDIHLIGFSLGAHILNYIAKFLRPYKLPRITGLDPAMPGFITALPDNKLDKSDAEFVDVLHTNAFFQGQPQDSGHVDFYVNGGVAQPGCWAENRFFACNHHRAPLYFAESIATEKGFWGWPCSSYFSYLFGQCPPKEPQVIMGEHVNRSTRGIYLVITESVAPFAVGKFTGPAIEIYYKSENKKDILGAYERDLLMYLNEDELLQSMIEENDLNVMLTNEFVGNMIDYHRFP